VFRTVSPRSDASERSLQVWGPVACYRPDGRTRRWESARNPNCRTAVIRAIADRASLTPSGNSSPITVSERRALCGATRICHVPCGPFETLCPPQAASSPPNCRNVAAGFCSNSRTLERPRQLARQRQFVRQSIPRALTQPPSPLLRRQRGLRTTALRPIALEASNPSPRKCLRFGATRPASRALRSRAAPNRRLRKLLDRRLPPRRPTKPIPPHLPERTMRCRLPSASTSAIASPPGLLLPTSGNAFLIITYWLDVLILGSS
jgi:hypothetical protein